VGDHRSLMAEGGLYKRLYEAQNVDPDLVYPNPSDAEVNPPAGAIGPPASPQSLGS
jgi:hypothetical protein